MLLGMTAGDDRGHTWYQVRIAIDQLKHPIDRFETFSHMPISGSQPFVARITGNFEFALLKKYPIFGKSSVESSGMLPPHDSTTMVEMKMRQQQVSDIARLHTKLLQTID